MKKTIVQSAAITNPVPSHALATRAGPFVFMSGQMGINEATARPYGGYHELGRQPPYPALGSIAPNTWEEAIVAQTWAAYDRMGTLLEELGGRRQDLIFHSIYLRDMRDHPTMIRTRSPLFQGGLAPPVTASQVPALCLADARIYFDPLGYVPDTESGFVLEMLTSRHLVQSALSSYQLGARVGPLMFFAGVVGAVPDQGIIIHDAGYLPDDVPWPAPPGSFAARHNQEPVAAQTAFIYNLFGRFLEEHGADFNDLVKLNVYLRHMTDLPTVERVADQIAGRVNAAISHYGVESLATRFFLIEVEGVALTPGQGWDKTIVGSLEDRDGIVCPYGRDVLAARAGEIIFVTGLTAFDAVHEKIAVGPEDLPEEGRKIVERVLSADRARRRSVTATAAATQAWMAFWQMQRILERLNSGLSSVLKITVYLRDIDDFAVLEAVSEIVFGQDPPALTVLQVADLPLREARVEIDAIALADR